MEYNVLVHDQQCFSPANFLQVNNECYCNKMCLDGFFKHAPLKLKLVFENDE